MKKGFSREKLIFHSLVFGTFLVVSRQLISLVFDCLAVLPGVFLGLRGTIPGVLGGLPSFFSKGPRK